MTYLLYLLMKTMVFVMYLSPFVIVFLASDSIVFRLIALTFAIWVVLMVPLYPYTSRVMFCSKIKRMCRRAKLTCKSKHFCLLPFFRQTDGFDMEIEDWQGVVYSIKFFGGNVNAKGIHLRSENQAEIIRYLVSPRLGRRHAMGTVERTEHSRKIVPYEMPIARHGESILLFSPSPYQMTALIGPKLIPVGNGEEYAGFTIYTARGFMDYFKRKFL